VWILFVYIASGVPASPRGSGRQKAFEINSRARASIRLKDAMFQAPFQ
jgi:hypothetical protein